MITTAKNEAKQLLLESLKNTVSSYDNFAVLFSGGVDSLVLATIAKKLKKNFTCYTIGFPKSRDLGSAATAATIMKLCLKIKIINSNYLELIIKQLKEIISPEDAVSFEIACVLYAALEMVKEDKIKVALTGTGAEETLTGYKRHTTVAPDKLKSYMIKSLKEAEERDVKREQLLAKYFKLKIVAPYLAEDFVATAMQLPTNFKISSSNNKIILRELAIDLGIPKEFAFRKKVAIQYGSSFDREMLKLARRSGFNYRKDYLNFL